MSQAMSPVMSQAERLILQGIENAGLHYRSAIIEYSITNEHHVQIEK